MVSKSTSREIRKHLFDVAAEFKIPLTDIEIFEQREIPAFDFNGQILYKSKDEVYTAPSKYLILSLLKTMAVNLLILDGNGGIYEVIGDLLPKLEQQGVMYFHVYCVDNILCRVGDPAFLGYSIKVNADCTAKVNRILKYQFVKISRH
jgi:UDP-N-acetylglucosamine/UDP-N-acetylgalactosamine diphosphorylase